MISKYNDKNTFPEKMVGVGREDHRTGKNASHRGKYIEIKN